MRFREAVLLLTHQVPLPLDTVKIQLSSRLEEGTYGECSIDADKGVIRIRINKTAPLIAQVDSLIHEWAHALLAGTHAFEDHDALWGVCYAQCYRAVYEPDG